MDLVVQVDSMIFRTLSQSDGTQIQIRIGQAQLVLDCTRKIHFGCWDLAGKSEEKHI